MLVFSRQLYIYIYKTKTRTQKVARLLVGWDLEQALLSPQLLTYPKLNSNHSHRKNRGERGGEEEGEEAESKQKIVSVPENFWDFGLQLQTLVFLPLDTHHILTRLLHQIRSIFMVSEVCRKLCNYFFYFFNKMKALLAVTYPK